MRERSGFRMSRLTGLLAAGAVGATMAFTGAAQASTVNDLLYKDANYPDGQWNNFSDGNRQWVHENRSGAQVPVLGVGDTLRGLFRFSEIRHSDGPVFSRNDDYGELFGMFNLIVTEVEPDGTTHFGADPNFWSGGEQGLVEGAVMVLWESPTGISDFFDADFSGQTAQQLLDARIAQGDRYLTAGFTGERTDVEYGPDPGDVVNDVILPNAAAEERWISEVVMVGGNPEVQSDYGMSLLETPEAELFDALAPLLRPWRGFGAEIDGEASEIRETSDARFDFRGDNTNVNMHLVPLPAAAWSGLVLLGLLGGGKALRRRRNREQIG